MVDLGGYVIILVETHDKKVKLYGKEGLFCEKFTKLFLDVKISTSFVKNSHGNI